jgi:hypothetical protein
MKVNYKGLKLSPCPFDGKKCSFHKGEHDEADIKVVCSGCGAEGPLFNDSYGTTNTIAGDARANAEEAAKHWNKRVPVNG